MVRSPIVAGQFYDDRPKELENQVSRSFTHNFGPGTLPAKERTKKIIAAISPHAGYAFSGPCAANVYKEIAEVPVPDVYVLLGLSHNGFPSAVSSQDWETPLGKVAVDKDFAKAVSEEVSVRIDEKIHAREHSIEVQLPFLQFINKDQKFKICPIICSDDIEFDAFAKGIVKAAEKTKKSILIIASSDFTHFGITYGYMPFSKDIKENMYRLDEGAIEWIKKRNAYQFLKYVEEKQATICGRNPIAVAVHCAKLLGAKDATVLKYYTSADIMGDYSTAVGYAAIIFERKEDERR